MEGRILSKTDTNTEKGLKRLMQKDCERNGNLELGIYDNPFRRNLSVLTVKVNIFQNNIAVFGLPGSRKTAFIQNLIVRLHENAAGSDIKECIYILDFGGDLWEYASLPCTGGYFTDLDGENIKRVFKVLKKRIESDIFEIQESNTHITLIIENLSAFADNEKYRMYSDLLLKILRDGTTRMISVVFSSNDVNGIEKFISAVSVKAAFDLSDEKLKYIFNSSIPEFIRIPGRGIININSDMYEFQSFLPFESDIEFMAFKNRAYKEISNARMPRRMERFGTILDIANFKNYCNGSVSYETCNADADKAVLGLDYYDHEPVQFDIRKSRYIAVYGKKKKSRLNFLVLLVKNYIEKKKCSTIVLYDDERNELAGLNDFISKNYKNINLCSIGSYKYWKNFLESNIFVTDEDAEKREFFKDILFIVSCKALYQSDTNIFGEAYSAYSDICSESQIYKDFLQMIPQAAKRNWTFVFSDVRKNTDTEKEKIMNSLYSSAFLFDDIENFVRGYGKESVFSDLDPQELKGYFECGENDGYFYDIDNGIFNKLKFVKI